MSESISAKEAIERIAIALSKLQAKAEEYAIGKAPQAYFDKLMQHYKVILSHVSNSARILKIDNKNPQAIPSYWNNISNALLRIEKILDDPKTYAEEVKRNKQFPVKDRLDKNLGSVDIKSLDKDAIGDKLIDLNQKIQQEYDPDNKQKLKQRFDYWMNQYKTAGEIKMNYKKKIMASVKLVKKANKDILLNKLNSIKDHAVREITKLEELKREKEVGGDNTWRGQNVESFISSSEKSINYWRLQAKKLVEDFAWSDGFTNEEITSLLTSDPLNVDGAYIQEVLDKIRAPLDHPSMRKARIGLELTEKGFETFALDNFPKEVAEWLLYDAAEDWSVRNIYEADVPATRWDPAEGGDFLRSEIDADPDGAVETIENNGKIISVKVLDYADSLSEDNGAGDVTYVISYNPEFIPKLIEEEGLEEFEEGSQGNISETDTKQLKDEAIAERKISEIEDERSGYYDR